jgi:hypothetical protein
MSSDVNYRIDHREDFDGGAEMAGFLFLQFSAIRIDESNVNYYPSKVFFVFFDTKYSKNIVFNSSDTTHCYPDAIRPNAARSRDGYASILSKCIHFFCLRSTTLEVRRCYVSLYRVGSHSMEFFA